MAETRYPGYNVLNKRNTMSWNAKTREVIEARLARPDEPHFFDAGEWAILRAICDRLVPQPAQRDGNGERIPVAALVDHKLEQDERDGYRHATLPPERDAWRLGLRALDAEARAAHGTGFAALDGAQQDALLRKAESGELHDPAWGGMPPKLFFKERVQKDVVHAYYAHPTAWSEIGFGGPAGPRGYVRLPADRRDPWEAVEAPPGADRTEIRGRNHRVR